MRIMGKLSLARPVQPGQAEACQARTLIHAYMDQWPDDYETFRSAFRGRRVRKLFYVPVVSVYDARGTIWRASFQDDERGSVPDLWFHITGEQIHQLVQIAESELGE